MISRMSALVIGYLLGSLLVGALSASAAPVTGTVQVKLILLPTSNQEKIGLTDAQFGGDLSLHLHIGDLILSSLSALSFKGVEFQSLTVTTYLGPALVRDVIVFAPNLIEIEQQRNLMGLTVYCANLSDPALPQETDLTLPIDVGFPACPVTTDNDLAAAYLYYLIEGNSGLLTINDFTNSTFADLTFARIFEGAGHLSQPLSFRKKIVELEISLGVLSIGLQGLFVNIGSPATPSWQKGFLVTLEMRLDELFVRSETWVGSKPGVECFAECSSIQRFHNGVLAPEALEGRLLLRDLRIAGILFGAQVEFGFDSSSLSLHILELTQQFVVVHRFLTILNTVRVSKLAFNSIQVLSQSIVAQLLMGDVAVIAVFNIWPKTDGAGGIRFYWNRLVTTFTPPGVKLTSDIQVCQDPNLCGTLPAVLTHDLYLTTSVGDITIDILIGFNSFFIIEFRQAAVNVAWRLGNIVLKSTTIVSGNALILQMFGFALQF